ncbi:unnamed protein product, partial [Rotaria magnacalcarata]
EIELTEVSTISEDKTHEASSLIQNAPLVDLLNPSNINDLPENYDESENESEFFVQEVLYTLIEEKCGPGIKVNGLHEQMNKFYFFFGLKLGYLLFSATEKLSHIIQSSSCCLQDVLSSAESLIRYFERIRGKIT